MTKKLSILLSLIFTLSVFTQAQTVQINQNASELLASLPDSEAVMFVDARRFDKDALPLLTNNDPARRADINRQIERFKTQSGIDMRDFEFFAAALDFSPKITSLFPPQGTLTLDPVVLARSRTNNSAQVLAETRRVSQTPTVGGKPLPVETRERKYKSVEIFTVQIDDATRVFGLFDLKNRAVSVAALDARTVAVGNFDAVRQAIDAFRGGKRVDRKLPPLAVKNPNAVIGFAGIVPGYISSRIKFGTPELSRPFRKVRGFYGSLETAENKFVMLTNLQTDGAAEAEELSRTINLIKEFIPGLLAQLPAVAGRAASAAINRAEKVSVQPRGTEVEIRAELAADKKTNNNRAAQAARNPDKPARSNAVVPRNP